MRLGRGLGLPDRLGPPGSVSSFLRTLRVVISLSGVKVTVASVGKDKVVVTAHGVRIEADALLEDIGEGVKFDVIVIPGGEQTPDGGGEAEVSRHPGRDAVALVRGQV